MKLAIMQPYFLPYIGYWQLIHAVDKFVIYDDVHFIKGGWINRNRILINGAPSYVTVPLRHPSPFRLICDIELQPTPHWRDKLLKTVEFTYRRAPAFDAVFPLLVRLVRYEANGLADYLAHQLKTLSGFLGIATEFVTSSRCYQNDAMGGQERVIDICRRERAKTYINPQGGQTLYDVSAFAAAGVDIRFLFSKPLPYRQRSPGFVPYLSIVDLLMEVGPDRLGPYLESYDLR